MRIVVVGCGHVGVTTGVCLAHCGYSVTLMDVDERRVRDLAQGTLPFFEEGLEPLLAGNAERLTFTTDIGAITAADVCILAVPSPSPRNQAGAVDLSFVLAAVEGMAGVLTERTHPDPLLIVNKCTVPVGSGQLISEVLRRALDGAPSGVAREVECRPRYVVTSCPEFLREGDAVQDTLHPDRLILGADDPEAGIRLERLYEPIITRSFPLVPGTPPASPPRPAVMLTTLVAAEMIKYAANSFLATKLSFINEMAGLCSAVGASVDDVSDGIGLDRRIGSRYLRAGLGWGGSCLGKDLQALMATAREYQLDTPLLRAVVTVNDRQRGVVLRLLQEELRVVRGTRIGLLGLAFKAGTDDLRDAPSLEIADQLIAAGASVAAFDPAVTAVPRPELAVLESVEQVAIGSDALVIVTEWPEFARLDWIRLADVMRRRVLIDGRNLVDRAAAEAAGFRYRGIGR